MVLTRQPSAEKICLFRAIEGRRVKALPGSIDETIALLERQNYVCGRDLGTVAFLSLKLGKPLFLEGEAGVGKTEIAKAIAAALGAG
jgi:MoxR-like ATPase